MRGSGRSERRSRFYILETWLVFSVRWVHSGLDLAGRVEIRAQGESITVDIVDAWWSLSDHSRAPEYVLIQDQSYTGTRIDYELVALSHNKITIFPPAPPSSMTLCASTTSSNLQVLPTEILTSPFSTSPMISPKGVDRISSPPPPYDVSDTPRRRNGSNPSISHLPADEPVTQTSPCLRPGRPRPRLQTVTESSTVSTPMSSRILSKGGEERRVEMSPVSRRKVSAPAERMRSREVSDREVAVT